MYGKWNNLEKVRWPLGYMGENEERVEVFVWKMRVFTAAYIG